MDYFLDIHKMNCRKSVRERENRLINRYFKYEKLLQQDVLYLSERGSRTAKELIKNKILSEILGYKTDMKPIKIDIPNDKKNYRKITKVIDDNNCMICGTKLVRHFKDGYCWHRLYCSKCDLYSSKLPGVPLAKYYFYDFGNEIERKEEKITIVHEDEYNKIIAEISFVERLLRNCYCESIEYRRKNSLLDVFIKKIKYRPGIYIDGQICSNIRNIECAEKISKAHLAILGWRKIPLKLRRIPLKRGRME